MAIYPQRVHVPRRLLHCLVSLFLMWFILNLFRIPATLNRMYEWGSHDASVQPVLLILSAVRLVHDIMDY